MEIKKLSKSIFSSRYYITKKLRKEVEYIIQHFISKNNSILDYGCGNSPYREMFNDKNSKYVTADIVENILAEVHLDSKGQVPLDNNSFDTIISTQVLEHVDNPNLYLSEVKRLLKKDGTLILSTHGYWLYHTTPNDYWRWTSAGLKKILSENGFDIIYFNGIMNRSSVGLQLFQDGLLFKLPSFIIPIFCFFMQIGVIFFDKLSSKLARDADACVYVIVARLK